MFLMHKKQKILIVIFFILIFLNLRIDPITAVEPLQATEPEPYYEPIERFGITAPYNYSVEDLELFNIRSVLDWKADNTVILPDSIDYIHVLKVSDELYSDTLNNLPTLIPNNLGEVWIIGNEPDRFCLQDSVNPEIYAERYHQIATNIRSLDPTAKLGFGTVVQPTPIRIRYLERAIDKLVELSGGNRESAMNLIDIWSIHAFILNEHPFTWGAGVPVGFYTYTYQDVIDEKIREECYTGEVYDEEEISDKISISDFSDTHSIEIFIERIIFFRNWMYKIGEQEKPLWITEYGSLFPPIDPPCPPGEDNCVNYVNISDAETANFMIDTFNYLLYAKNDSIGFPEDDYHLVQRWYWYSLNDYRYNFGGSLLDPDNNYELTLVGNAYKSYTDYLISSKIFLPLIFR